MEKNSLFVTGLFKSVCNCNCELKSVLNRVVYEAIHLVYGRGVALVKTLTYELWPILVMVQCVPSRARSHF